MKHNSGTEEQTYQAMGWGFVQSKHFKHSSSSLKFIHIMTEAGITLGGDCMISSGRQGVTKDKGEWVYFL